MGANIAGHILDQPDDRYGRLVEQVDRAGGVDQRKILRRGDDDRARRLLLLDERELDVAGAGGQVDEDQVAIVPVGIDQLVKRIACHRPAPRDRLAGLHEMGHGEHRHAILGGHGDQLLLRRLRTAPLARHQPGLRGAVDVGIDQADADAQPLQGDRDIGRDGRFADAALAAADGDQAAGLLLGCHRHAHILDARQRAEPGLYRALQLHARIAGQARHVEDHAGIALGKARRGGTFGGDQPLAADGVDDRVEGGGEGFTVGHAVQIATKTRCATVFPWNPSYNGRHEQIDWAGIAADRGVERERRTVGWPWRRIGRRRR
jgi:hypothetical protein